MNGLDQEQSAYLRAALERARNALQRQLAGDVAADLRTPAYEVEASPSDNASQRTLNQLVQGTTEHTAAQLRVVKHALAKFGDGSYGLCENCGEAIGYSRLHARPEARLCIVCQTRMEQRRR